MSASSIETFVDYALTLKGDEKGEAQVFLDRLFQAFGHAGYKEAGATLEDRVRRKGKATGFADLVWPGRVLVEMKKRGENLQKHYDQARDYWFNLFPKPKYVVLSNFDEFWVYDFDVQHDPVDKVALDRLVERRAAFGFMLPEPEKPLFANNRLEVTDDASHKIAAVYNSLIDAKEDADRARRFVLQCVAAMFFEDTELLPDNLFSRLVDECLHGGGDAYDLLGGLFRQMADPTPARGGRYAGVRYFNGALFRDVEPVTLGKAQLLPLRQAGSNNWKKVQPEVIGTLFQDIMDPAKRHASGAHFTHEADIQKIVQPTIVRPWRARIEAASTLKELVALRDELLRYRVLDPACGSGNFLYVAFRELKRLEIELIAKGGQFTREARQRAGFAMSSRVSVRQMYGLDNNPFAVELARVTLTIAKELAKREALETADAEEVDLTQMMFDDTLPLDDLSDNIRQADALFTEWPEVDAIIGNPPFVSKNNMQPELGAAYVDKLRSAYPEIPGRADYCVYWFRKVHDHLDEGERAGLVGTNTIRQNYSREGGLDYIVQHGGTITEAVSSQPWSGEAAVYVSIANWVKGDAPGSKRLFFQRDAGPREVMEVYELDAIGAALSPEVDVTGAADLAVNKAADVCYQGQTHGHEGFLLTPTEAAALLANHPTSAPFVHPYMTGSDMLSTNPPYPTRYAIDLNRANDVFEAKAAGRAFEIVKAHVMPAIVAKAEEEKAKTGKNVGPRQNHAVRWWRFWRGRPELLDVLSTRNRYIACSRVTKRPIFAFVSSQIHPSDVVQTFQLEDDYSFGIIQSVFHWRWFEARGATLKSDPTYTPSTVWNSFPWPQAPALNQVRAVAEAAVALRQLRRDLMYKHRMSFRDLYRTLEEPGANPLRDAHARLDDAVRATYGIKPKAEPLAFLLALNHEVAAREKAGETVVGPGLPPCVENADAFVTEDCIQAPELVA